MATIVGIDPSLTSAGVAVLRGGKPVHLSHHGYSGHSGASYQMRSRRVRKQVLDVCAIIRDHTAYPDLVVIEEHPYAVRACGAEFDRSGLWHGIFGQLDYLGWPIAVVHPGTHKRWITGCGAAKKREVVETMRAWYPGQPIANDDEADALGHALIGAFHLGDPMPFPVKDRHHSGLEKVVWP